MNIKAVEVFAFKFDHHYRLSGRTEAPDRLIGTDYYFEPQWRHVYSRITESCLVKITTNTGLVGWGEAQAPVVPEVPATLIARLFGPAILGLDPEDPEFIYNRLYHLNHVRGHTASFTIDAIAGIDMAVWDIKAQAKKEPLNRLLGKVITDRLPLYVSGLRKPDLLERQTLAKEKIEEGFQGIKIFIGETAKKTLEECAAIRSAIGSNSKLALDAICRHDYSTAYQIGRGLDELNVSWFESPMDPENTADHAKLVKKIETPIAVGEPLRTAREFEPWIKQDAMQIAQPDITRCSITGGQRIIQMAQDHNLRLGLHIGVCTAIGIAATWHMASIISNPINQEHQLEMFETANKVLTTPLRVEAGQAIVPSESGLGIVVDESFVRAQSTEKWIISSEGIHYDGNPNYSLE